MTKPFFSDVYLLHVQIDVSVNDYISVYTGLQLKCRWTQSLLLIHVRIVQRCMPMYMYDKTKHAFLQVKNKYLCFLAWSRLTSQWHSGLIFCCCFCFGYQMRLLQTLNPARGVPLILLYVWPFFLCDYCVSKWWLQIKRKQELH